MRVDVPTRKKESGRTDPEDQGGIGRDHLIAIERQGFETGSTYAEVRKEVTIEHVFLCHAH